MATPEGWRSGTISDLASHVADKANPSANDDRPYIALEHMAQGQPTLLGWSAAREATSTKTVFKKHDVLYGKLRPNLDKAVLAPFDGVCSTDVLALRAMREVDPKFLLEALHSPSFVAHAVSTASGTKMPRTGWGLIAGYALPIPPLPEQRKIAAILSSVDEVIEKTEAVIEQLQVVKKAMMQELLTRGLPGRHTRFKQTEIGEVPEEWEVRTYEGLAASVPRAIQSGPFGSALRHEEFTDTGGFVVGIDNVQDGYFSRGAEHRVRPQKFQELAKFRLRPLDLLIVITGASTGRACVFPDGFEEAVCTKHVYRLTVDPAQARSYFLLACIKYLPVVRDLIQGSAQGLSRPGLNKALLAPVRFPVPSLPEQERIVEVMHRLDARIETETRTVTDARVIKAALSAVLLTGELRVTPDEDAA